MTEGIIIGRFQPLHDGHKHLIRVARKRCFSLLILVGSSNKKGTIKNPWSYTTRSLDIEDFIYQERITYTRVRALRDVDDDTEWMNQVYEYIEFYGFNNPKLFGYMKPGNDYLNWFPDIPFENIESDIEISGTEIRRRMFEARDPRVPIDVQKLWDNLPENENDK